MIDIEFGTEFDVKIIEKIKVTSDISEDIEVKKIVDFYLGKYTKKIPKK